MLWKVDNLGHDLRQLVNIRPEALHLDVTCSRCYRRGRLSVARVVEQYGTGAMPPDTVAGINADCLGPQAHGAMQRCDTYFPELGSLLW